MEILAAGIQDNSSNVTRFVILAPADHARTGSDKTSLCFSFKQDVPGILYEVMGEFARRNINLAKVESRPTKQSLGEYIFLVDCEGHREDPLVRERDRQRAAPHVDAEDLRLLSPVAGAVGPRPNGP